MKKLFIINIFTIVFVILMSDVSIAMTYDEFMESYPNEYIYRVDFPTGYSNYISSPAELQFEVSEFRNGSSAVSGKYLVIKNPEGVTYHRLTYDGYVITRTDFNFYIYDYRTPEGDDVGFEGDIDIYIWSGYGFFLPLPSQLVGKMGGMIRVIMMTAGFGILSLMVLILLLKVLKIYPVGL